MVTVGLHRIAPVVNRHACRPRPLRSGGVEAYMGAGAAALFGIASSCAALSPARPGPSRTLPWSSPPTRRHPRPWPVPFAPQRRQRPRHLDILAGSTLVQPLLQPAPSPSCRRTGHRPHGTPARPAGAGSGPARTGRPGRRSRRRPVLGRGTARIARFRAPRRPYRRAQKLVSTSTMSRTRSSVVSPSSTTTMRRPWAANAAARYSTPNRASRSRCSTTIVVACGSASSRRSFARLPFSPAPTSATTSATASPSWVAHSGYPGDLRSRSRYWSWDDTRNI